MVESINDLDERGQGVASCPSKQYDWIRILYERLPYPKKDEIWYLICAKWWQNHIIRGMPLSTLDNSLIIDRVSKSLKFGLSEGIHNDYIIVDRDLWQQMKSVCNIAVSSEIQRKVIEDADGTTRVEIYPYDFQVCVCDCVGNLCSNLFSTTKSGSPWNSMTFSCKDSMGDIFDTVLKQLGIPSGVHCRWWRKPFGTLDSDPFVLINLNEILHEVGVEGGESVTLDQINVASGDFILVEPLNSDGSWPRECVFAQQTSDEKKYYPGKLVMVSQEKWREGKVLQVDEQLQKIFVQPADLPEEYSRWYPFESDRIQEKESFELAVNRAPSSPDSSSSTGSYTRSKRNLESDMRTGVNGSVPATTRLRIGCGIKGLQNLGNTCFMASTLQCLNRTMPFTEYFISREFIKDLNFENPLGMKGQLAKEYAKLLHEIWFEPPDRPSGASNSVAPFGIKRVIATHAPIFSGFRQHDSQELLAFLLDGLHEDVNRVTKKPYTPAIESAGRDDEIVAEEAWNTHLARNRSVVVDLFQGQLKSTVVCPQCERVSVTFDPMMYLSLPLQAFDVRTLSVSVVFADIFKKPIIHSCEVPKSGTINSLVSVIGQSFGMRPEQLMICEIYANDIHKTFGRTEKISMISPSDIIYAYEVKSEEFSSSRTYQPIWIKHVHVSPPNAGTASVSSSNLFAFPRPLYVPRGVSHAELHSRLMEIVQSLCVPEACRLSPDDVLIKIVPRTFGYHHPQNILLRDDISEWSVPENIICDLFVHWSAQAYANYFDDSLKIGTRSGVSRGSDTPDITLQDCIDLFTGEEILSEKDPWYCSSCKQFQQATKKFDLWKLPKILIVHLKRFQYTSYSRSKLDYYVDFPIEGFDLTRFVKGPQRDSSVVYDLYAISNHYGGFGGGHYTAYGQCSQDGKWYSFDDSLTQPISVNQIKTRAAYVLFYQLREPTSPIA